jgi:hypothetical protein
LGINLLHGAAQMQSPKPLQQRPQAIYIMQQQWSTYRDPSWISFLLQESKSFFQFRFSVYRTSLLVYVNLLITGLWQQTE